MAKKKTTRKKTTRKQSTRKKSTTQSKAQTKKTTGRKSKARRSTKRPASRTKVAGSSRDLIGKTMDWRKLSHDIAGALHSGSEQLSSHVRELEGRASKMTGPARKHLLDAAKSLRKAQQEAQKPIRDELSKGLMSIARTIGLPLGTTPKGGGRMPVAPTPSGGEGRGKNQKFVLDQLQLAGPQGARVNEIKEAAKAAGLNATSVGQAVTKMASDGQIKRVGRGRYAIKG